MSEGQNRHSVRTVIAISAAPPLLGSVLLPKVLMLAIDVKLKPLAPYATLNELSVFVSSLTR